VLWGRVIAAGVVRGAVVEQASGVACWVGGDGKALNVEIVVLYFYEDWGAEDVAWVIIICAVVEMHTKIKIIELVLDRQTALFACRVGKDVAQLCLCTTVAALDCLVGLDVDDDRRGSELEVHVSLAKVDSGHELVGSGL
jgi:hypothetical protein